MKFVGPVDRAPERFGNLAAENGRANKKFVAAKLFFAADGADTLDFKLERISFTADSMCAQKNVKSIVLPKNLCEIQELAFAEWGIEAITIPSTVTTVGTRAFAKCANLKKACL